MKAKDKQCSRCPYFGPLWKSNPALCKNCATRAKNTLTQTEDGCEAKPFKYQTKALKRSVSLSAEQIRDKRAMNEFFRSQDEYVPERCQNCNRKLNAFSQWAKRCVSAHILGKATFKSVSTHPGNIMFLGVHLFSECGCHSEWDNSDASHRKTMKCYSLALEKVMTFYDELTPHEQVQAEKYLGIESRLSKAI